MLLRESSSNKMTERLIAFHRECDEHLRRLDRLANQFHEHVDIFAWYDIERLVPIQVGSELKAAFERRESVYRSLIQQVRISTDENLGEHELEQASIFLQREFPVLIYLYYVLLPNAVDVYPGPQANFFWELERGSFYEELPTSTKIAQSGPGLIYAEVSTIKKRANT